MTDIHQQNLADFFADTDIESLRKRGLEEFGVDIAGVYCQHTGRKVGTFDDFVIQFAIDEESTDDEDALIDALYARCVASMRPTPMLNRPDRVTLLNLAERHPVDILCYLANRLHATRGMATVRDRDVLEPYFARIALYQRWTLLAASGADLRPWIHWLLELDAKRNLHDIAPPTLNDSLLLAQVDFSNREASLLVFEQWTFARIAEFEKRDNEALAQDKWMRGNQLTQPAYARSWLENPQFASKRAEMSAKAKAKGLTPGKPKSEKALKLDSKVSQFLHLLDDIMDGGGEAATPVKAGPKLMTGANLSFLRKKESI